MKRRPSIFWKVLGIPAMAFSFIADPVDTEAGESSVKHLTIGTEDKQVEQLQELLHEQGLLEKEHIDGVFEDDTAEAVKDYQKDHNLHIDGIAGPVTLGALEVLEKGDEGELVRTLQDKLNNLGFYQYNVDGFFEQHTHEAVKSFQDTSGIIVDGTAGSETFSALDHELSNKGTSIKKEKQAEDSLQRDSARQKNQSIPEVALASKSKNDQQAPEGRTLQVDATAYTAECTGCSGITATGVNLNDNPNEKVIAVDPSVIPLGSEVHIEGYGTYKAADTGGAIHGNRIDIHMPDKNEALRFGRQNLQVTLIE